MLRASSFSPCRGNMDVTLCSTLLRRRDRPRLLAPTLFSALLAVALPADARAGKLHVSVERFGCPDPKAIAEVIERNAAGMMQAQPDLVLVLGRTDSAGQVRVRLFGAPATHEKIVSVRRMPSPELRLQC